MLLRIVVLAVLLVVVVPPAFAQVDGPVSADFDDVGELLAKPFGVRSLGMGWCGVADGTVAANLYYNPANLVSHRGFELAFETQNWADELDFYDGGAAARFKIGKSDTKKFHIGAALWNGRQKNTFEGPDGTVETTNWYLNAAVAFGYRTERFEIGLGGAVKPVFVDFESLDQDATAWAFDVGLKIGGLLMDKNGHTLTTYGGASILHTGGDAESENATSQMPTESRLGVSIRYGTPLTSTRAQSGISALALTLNAEIADHSFQREIQTATGSKSPPMGSMIGAELCVYNVFNFRYGYMDDGLNGNIDSDTYGLGIQFSNEKFEAALDISHLPELYSEGPSVTSTGFSLAWFF